MKRGPGVVDEAVRGELDRFPPPLLEEFQNASSAMTSSQDDTQLAEWARLGIGIAEQTGRSWEAASRYFAASPKVVGLMPHSYFVKWSECGSALCQESHNLAVSYFDASPGTMARLRARHIERWAGLGRSLYKGTWKSGTLSCKFFEASPTLLGNLALPELERFAGFLDSLALRSYDLATECLDLGQQVFPLLDDNGDLFLSLASGLMETSWRQTKSFFEVALKALPAVEAGQRVRFLKLIDGLRSSPGAINLPAAMLEASESLARVDKESHGPVLGLAEAVLAVSPAATPEFIRSSPSALERVGLSQLERWQQEGVRILKQNSDGGMVYFKAESSHSQRVLEALSSTVEFERIKDLLELYCRALAGADVELAASEDLVEKNIGWVSNEAPSTEGSTVYVPSHVDKYSAKEENFAWFKVISTHQVAHLEFGSFGFEFERPSTLFRDLRPRLELGQLSRRQQTGEDNEDPEGRRDGSGLEERWVTDMQRYFGLFDDRALALDVFAVVEDGRLDARVKSEYPGLRQPYEGVQRDALENRPDIKSLHAREAMVEFLVRVSLQKDRRLPAPAGYVAEAQKVIRIATRVLRSSATVEDAAEASLRIYAIISRVPNEELGPDEWQDVDVDEEPSAELSEAEDEMMLEQLLGGGSEEQPPDGEAERDYESSQSVDYRGDFKPELVQLLSRLRSQGEAGDGEGSGDPITQEMLKELLQNSAELDMAADQSETRNVSGTFADNLLKEAGLSLPKTPEFGQGPLIQVDEQGGSLEPSEPQSFVYDEWDFRAEDYKPRWCVVRQKGMAEGDPGYYAATLHGYGALVGQIRRQFELMVPEMFRKVRKLEDGEELDIDAVIEALIDMRTGVGPSEKIFWRRNKVQRDVAVVFLLDTSASTAEAIDDSKKVAEEWEAPNDPVEYMAWLRTRRGEGMKRSYKRIIDLEKEAVVLLINALEAIGDVYGIYAFSGYGRENVEFYTIKDIEEGFSDRVKRRIDRVAPLHATRMGPAIRHATSKLESQDARTKLLFLISDGRPQDRGYSREGVEKEYAVHDTKMALDEAGDKDITAFCLTVDKNGHDYLKTMCEDIGYEVLDDIHALPRRLLYLYRRLTT